MQLQGKVAVITGAVDGMGLAATRRFLAEGANVVMVDIQQDKGERLEREFDGSVRFVHGDVRDESTFERSIEIAIHDFGRLDIMYHNAGAAPGPEMIHELSVEHWDDVQAFLLRSSMLAVKWAVPPMREVGGGSVILTSSVAARSLKARTSISYGVAKGGVLHLTRMAALQYAPDLIRVNALVPGGVATSIVSKSRGYSQEMSDAVTPHLAELLYARWQPLPRAGTPEDIAAAALFLASDESRWVTGIELPVDGGVLLKRSIDDEDEIRRALEEAERRAFADLKRGSI